MEIQIERNIPAPSLPANQKYPWHTMEVGDSFLFPLDRQHGAKCASIASKRYAPKRFLARKTKDGMRCWRVE